MQNNTQGASVASGKYKVLARDPLGGNESQPFSLYKPLASLASFAMCNRAPIVVNARARSASGFVLLKVCLSVRHC